MASHSQISKWTPATLDILKSLKQGFVGAKLDHHENAKVWLRQDGKLVIEKPDDLWKHHFKRRQENCNCGFFTVPWEPYKCLGGALVLDSNELLCQTFAPYLENIRFAGKLKKSTDKSLDLPCDITKRKEEFITDNVIGRSVTAGYGQIRELLKIEDERRVSLRAGLPYMDHIKKIDKRIEDKKEKPINGMILMSTSDFAFMFGGARESPEADHNESTDENMPARKCSSTEGASSSSTSSTSSTSSDSLLRVHSGLTERLERMRKDNIEFLENIYRIITIMRNIKMKDLRSKHPLSRIQLRDLEKSQQTHFRGNKIAGLSHLQKRISTETTYSLDMSPTNNSSRGESRHHPLLGPKRRNRLASLFGASGPLVNVGSRTSTMVNDRISRMMMESSRDNRVETWDDLLKAGNIPEGEHELPVQVIPDTMISKAIKWSRYVSERNLFDHSILDDKHKTIWQIVANEKVKASRFEDSHKHIRSKDPIAICYRVRRNMEKVNRTLRESTNAEIKNINRDRLAAFRYKFGTFREIKGTTLIERHLVRMREPREYDNGQPEIPDVIPSKWMDELTERIYNTVGTDDTEVNAALFQLGQYSQMEVKNTSQTKARLCLVVMSLAAYDVCKISTQLAIKFILEKIIQVSGEDFHHWLDIRKLPVVILK